MRSSRKHGAVDSRCYIITSSSDDHNLQYARHCFHRSDYGEDSQLGGKSLGTPRCLRRGRIYSSKTFPLRLSLLAGDCCNQLIKFEKCQMVVSSIVCFTATGQKSSTTPEHAGDADSNSMCLSMMLNTMFMSTPLSLITVPDSCVS